MLKQKKAGIVGWQLVSLIIALLVLGYFIYATFISSEESFALVETVKNSFYA
jgi:hypothetical protein